MIEFAVNPRAAVQMLNGIAARSADMRPAMTIIRTLITEGHERNLESEGSFLGSPWPRLSEATVARKRRQGLPGTPLEATGRMMTALKGGTGKRTRVSRTSVRVGVSKDLFWTIFHLAGAKGGRRRGDMPARPVLGIAQSTRLEAETIMLGWLEYGRT